MAASGAKQELAPKNEKKKKSGFKAKLKKFLYGDEQSKPVAGHTHRPSSSLW